MTPDNSGMPPLPEPDVMYEELGHEYDAYSRDAMHAYGRQVAQMCAEICEGRAGMRGTGAWTCLTAAADAIRERFGVQP